MRKSRVDKVIERYENPSLASALTARRKTSPNSLKPVTFTESQFSSPDSGSFPANSLRATLNNEVADEFYTREDIMLRYGDQRDGSDVSSNEVISSGRKSANDSSCSGLNFVLIR